MTPQEVEWMLEEIRKVKGASRPFCHISIHHSFFYHTDTVSGQEFLQILDLTDKLASLIGILHHDSLRAEFHNLGSRLDVLTLFDGLLHGGERLVLYQLESAVVVFQSIAGDTCFQVISLGEATVDDHQLAIRFDRVLALQGLDRDMAVDDVAVLALHTEFVQIMSHTSSLSRKV